MTMWKSKKKSPKPSIVEHGVSDDASTTSSIMKKPKTKVKRRHSVDFAGTNDVVEIESAEECEKEHMWYTKEEFSLIKERNSLVIKMMKKGIFEETDEQSVRGLEHRLRDGLREREDNKFEGLNAVLFEQDRQISGRKSDPTKIARKYEEAAERAKDSAVSMALLDATTSYAYGNGAIVVVADDDNSVVSDIDSVLGDSDDWYEKKMKLQSVFKGLSLKNADKRRRRASL